MPLWARSSVPSPSPSSRIPEHVRVDAFWCSSITFYHPDTKNATTWSHSLCQGCFPHPRHENATPVSRFRVRDDPAPLPLPSTTQTRRMRPYGHILRVWDVADTPNMKMRPQCRVLRVWGVPAPFPLPSTTQTRGGREGRTNTKRIRCACQLSF